MSDVAARVGAGSGVVAPPPRAASDAERVGADPGVSDGPVDPGAGGPGVAVDPGAGGPGPAALPAGDPGLADGPAGRGAGARDPVSPGAEPVTVPEAEPSAAAEDGAAPGPGAWPRWRSSLLAGFWTWLAGMAMYVAVTAVAWVPFGDPPATVSRAYEAWHRWDTTWYVIIADYGYRFDPRSAAFFPLYPMLVRIVNRLLPGGAFEAALVVSVLSCLAALILVHRLTAEIMGEDVARRTTFYLLAFPTGFYLAAAYNESLFVALAAGSLYCMRRRSWWAAGVLAGFASGTRLVGVLLGLAFAYEYLRVHRFDPRRFRPDGLAIALVPSGLLLYAWFCYRTFGDWLYFQRVQSNWFRDGYTLPWLTLWQDWRFVLATRPVLAAESMRNIINLSAAVGLLLMLGIALSRRWGLGGAQAYLVIFSVADILLPMSSPIHNVYPLSSMWRFALECLPVFMVLGRWGRDRRFDRVYLMAALAVQGVMILTFLHEQFVA